MTMTKEHIARLAAAEIEELFSIVGDLGHVGYRISLCKLKGFSHQQCASKFGISKQAAQRSWEKCIEKRYDITLKRIFQLK